MSLKREIRRVSTGAAAALLLGTAALASGVSEQDAPAINAVIGQSAEFTKAGTHANWHGPSGAHGVVTPGLVYSRATGSACTKCDDPCRKMDYTIVTAQAMSEYEGERCRIAPEELGAPGTWYATETDRQVRYLPLNPVAASPLVPTAPAPRGGGTPKLNILPSVSPENRPANGPNRALIAKIQRELASLRYYKGPADGNFGEATRNAVAEFLDDENSLLPNTPGKLLLEQIHYASARIVHGECRAQAAHAVAVACGRIAD